MKAERTTKAIWLLLAATLFMRALVPAGWMPDTGQPDVIVAKMCNSSAVVVIPLNRGKTPEESTKHESGPCLFAGFAGDAPLPEHAPVLSVSPSIDQQALATFAAFLLERTAFLLPPGRGPPVAA